MSHSRSLTVATDLPAPHREKLAAIVQSLGGCFTTEVCNATHFVTLYNAGDRAIQAQSVGAIVVGPAWVNACVRCGEVVSAAQHDSSVSSHENLGILSGLVLYLSTFYSGTTRETLKEQITNAGGRVTQECSEDVTHVVCRFRVGDAYRWAMRTGRAAVSAQWVDDCLQSGQVFPPRRLLHIPLPSNQPVSEMQGLQVSITGFLGVDRTDLEFMVRSTGATYTGMFTRNNTHLICGKPGTDKHIKASEWGTRVVQREWLEECVRQWQYVDEGPYTLERPASDSITTASAPQLSNSSNNLLFMFSGKPSKYERDVIERLGGQVSLALGQYDPQCTHIILKSLARTEKFLCGCAAGKWILKSDYIAKCDQENKFVDEELYEWSGDKVHTTKGKSIWEGAPKKWRRIGQSGQRAFANWAVALYGDTKPHFSFLKRLIEAGDGVVIRIDKGCVPQCKIDFAIVGKANADDPVISVFLQREIPCLSGFYLSDFLAMPESPDRSQYKVL